VKVTGVDPRDQRSAVNQPSYRVYFFTAEGSSDEYRVTEAELEEVLAWVEANRGADRTYVLYMEHEDDDGITLFRLSGVDPNDPSVEPGGTGWRPVSMDTDGR
jgi:hypothetical protein